METVNSPQTEGATPETPKIPRFRSVAYPSVTISHCAELVTKIQRIFGSLTFTSRDRIAKELNISEGHIQTQLSSCVQYNFLELRSGEGYKPTPLFIKIYRPVPGERIEDAYLEAFKNPELYKRLIEQFNGQELPQEAGLATILFRNYKVSDQASNLAAKIFIENANIAGALNGNSYFSVEGGGNEDDVIPFVEVKDPKEIIPANGTILLKPPAPKHEPNPAAIKLPVLLEDGKVIEIPLPNGVKKEDLEKIKKVIDAYL